MQKTIKCEGLIEKIGMEEFCKFLTKTNIEIYPGQKAKDKHFTNYMFLNEKSMNKFLRLIEDNGLDYTFV